MSDLISRQAAIDALMPIYKSASLRNRNVFSTARKCMAAIEDLPSAQIRTAEVRQSLLDVPSAEVEPVKRGKWIYDNQFHWYRASCSECGYKRVTDIKAEKWNDWSYCPNCGAKMEAAPTIIEAEEAVPDEP